ncbi:xylulokinase [Planococcus donghaensis MPA1U2]|uniref:Xylulose kinase n=1 Tax=Planococcus donghaensis MPA1U2 TaxID=933115 RepID=E7RG60_9BACL|nr:xylulokinase [Planococcus donghaensis]EGA90007.1 xylulokinase [Planococcus donghaensis MPA1U2]
MKYVIGIDLGSSAVKAILVDRGGIIHQTLSVSYPLIQAKSGYSEQDPDVWYEKTKQLIYKLVKNFKGNVNDIEAISFSGQMHGLVLLNENLEVMRNAILWNDTRTTEQCREIEQSVGKERLLEITKNQALEGFTLPKLLWVKQNEPEIFERIHLFLLPKDYLRFKITGELHTDYSDAAGTLLLNTQEKKWSREICQQFDVDEKICPELVESHAYIGLITAEFSEVTGLSSNTKVFAGGADNACGAISAGILSEGKALCSIGTSGVILSYEELDKRDYGGSLHYFNHGDEDAFYSMGVTLSAGHSLSWFRDTFAQGQTFESVLAGIESIPVGSNGLLFAPYLVGERTPHTDATIRASFIGIDAGHTQKHFTRAVLEGVTFSLKESLDILRKHSNNVNTIISIGGGAKSDVWLQMQADIFNVRIVNLYSEQGPALGAAILACYGCGWYNSLEDCTRVFISYEKAYEPIAGNVSQYEILYELYKEIYNSTKKISAGLRNFEKTREELVNQIEYCKQESKVHS